MTYHAYGLNAEAFEDRARSATETTYILGHSPDEIRRLIDQAAFTRPITERLLRSAGIEQGMRVLDLGCGAGDVSMLAGELVGTSGSVVGIDLNAQVLAVARARAQATGLPHVTFTEASVSTFSDPKPFDIVIARYVLLYQVDPVAFLRAAARFARPGAVLALHEFIVDRPVSSRPYVALWQQTADCILAAFRGGAPSHDAAGRLIEHFSSAGLPQPELFCELPIGGGVNTSLYAQCAELTRALLPRMVQAGIATAETVEINTLESRLRSAVTGSRSQVEGLPQVCAWARL